MEQLTLYWSVLGNFRVRMCTLWNVRNDMMWSKHLSILQTLVQFSLISEILHVYVWFLFIRHLIFQHHYSSLQSVSHDPSEIILISWFTAQKHIWLLSMLKKVVLFNIFVETEWFFSNEVELTIHFLWSQLSVLQQNKQSNHQQSMLICAILFH